MSNTYSDKLKDPRWQKRRLEILHRDNFECRKCESKTTTLHVHHKSYEKGTQPWEYEDQDLITLCKDCHDEVTNLKNDIGRVLCHAKLFALFQNAYYVIPELNDDQLETLTWMLNEAGHDPSIL